MKGATSGGSGIVPPVDDDIMAENNKASFTVIGVMVVREVEVILVISFPVLE